MEGDEGALQTLRERVLQAPASLEDADLLALLFAGRGRSLRGLERGLLAAAGGLRALASMEPAELCGTAGLGRERASQVLAALELARRAHGAGDVRPRLRTAGEVFHVLSFNTRNVLLSDVRVAEGTADACTVDPREVFRAALLARATAVVFAHNHPSGDPEPSEADLSLTRELQAGARLFHLRVLDHLVVGAGRFTSLAQSGFLRLEPVRAGKAPLTGEDKR